jgi:hypothetical protein
VLAYGGSVAKLVGLLLFLLFVADGDTNYAKYLGAPFAWVNEYLMRPTPIKIRPFDLFMLYVVIASKTSTSSFVRPMRTTLYLLLGTTVFFLAYGLTHGGEFRFAMWQTYLIVSTVLTTFAVAKACRSVADFAQLGKWLIAAAIYRAFMCWLSYFTWAKGSIGGSGEFLTQHCDTITWVVAIIVLLAQMLETRKGRLRNVLLVLFFLGAIEFNSRRLAWVSLGMSLVTFFFLLPPAGKARRGIVRLALILAPVILLYVIVGWGRPQKIFLPLRSLSSVTTQEDDSTLARNAENLGLIATAGYTNPAFGSGWGKPYVFLTMKYDISMAFELWRYVPHNSILGLLAFTGVLGFMGFWLAMPTAVFLNARVARLASDPTARSVAIVGVSQAIVSCNQLYGDMGIYLPVAMYVIAVSYAMALRLPMLAGVLTTPPAKAPAAVKGAPARAA